MTETEALERAYRRVLAFYPRAFRREHEEEMLAVLLDGAADGQRRPGLVESVDLIRGATYARLRLGAPRSARTVFVAVRLMYVGAALELIALATVLLTLGSLKATILQRDPNFTEAQWHAVVAAHIVPIAVGAPIAAGLSLWLAWANCRGHHWARIVFAALFAVNILSLLRGLAQHSATYSPAGVVAGGALCLVQLAAVVLIFSRRSGPYYTRESSETV